MDENLSTLPAYEYNGAYYIDTSDDNIDDLRALQKKVEDGGDLDLSRLDPVTRHELEILREKLRTRPRNREELPTMIEALRPRDSLMLIFEYISDTNDPNEALRLIEQMGIDDPEGVIAQMLQYETNPQAARKAALRTMHMSSAYIDILQKNAVGWFDFLTHCILPMIKILIRWKMFCVVDLACHLESWNRMRLPLLSITWILRTNVKHWSILPERC